MKENTPGVFEIDNELYQVKPCVYNFVKKYLYKKEHIQWVKCDQPNIKYGVETKDETKVISRRIKAFLDNTEIGRKVVKKFRLKSI